MQIPLLSGIYTDEHARFFESYPVNLEPTLLDTGLSKGYLAMACGVSAHADGGPGSDRGGYVWGGVHYRVMGSKLVRVSEAGTITILGDVGFGGPVSWAYSHTLLAIASGGRLYYWDGSALNQVTDPDLGAVLDVIWVDGFFMTTDGQYLVVTELNDPYAVNPLKYGASDVSPDPVNGLYLVRGDAYAINRYTIEGFRNIGGNGFPFQRNTGAMIPRGAVGTHAKARFLETFAFVGSAEGEAVSVYIAGGGETIPIGTNKVDDVLAKFTEAELAQIEVESRRETTEYRLYVHLPNGQTMVYLHKASQAAGQPVWYFLAGGALMDQPYPLRHIVLHEARWYGGTTDGRVGELDTLQETQFGEPAGWKFGTSFLYGEGRGGVAHSVELVGLPGRAPLGENPVAWYSYTLDGMTWSEERPISLGRRGERRKRMQWRPHSRFTNYIGLRFRGADTALAGFARIEAEIEALI